MDSQSTIAEPHVLILGGGFGGVAALKALKKAPVRVTLIDKNGYQTFQPLLYQVATDELSIDEVGFPLRNLLHRHPRWAFHRAAVTAIDLEKKSVTVEGMAPLTYDYLVIALGAVVNFFGIKGAAEHAFPLYTMRDAMRLKVHVLKAFEAADKDPSRVDDGALSVCVVGGGATGVEVAGALAELIRYELKDDYPGLPMEKAEIVLYELGPELLGPFKPRLRAYARRALEKGGVRVCLGEGGDACALEVGRSGQGPHLGVGRGAPGQSSDGFRGCPPRPRSYPRRRGSEHGWSSECVRGGRRRRSVGRQERTAVSAARVSR